MKASKVTRKPKADTVAFPAVLTIGHSTHPLDEFFGLLRAHGVTRVVDVRTVPRSFHNPQFNKTSLPRSLKKAGMGYVHMPGLGGLRHAKRDSINMGWRNASFRGYADYMQTPEFEESLKGLIQLANQERIALMCAEAVPWRCHRSLIADALLIRGIRTEDIMTLTRSPVHTLTPFAEVHGTLLTYPAEASQDTQIKPKHKRSGSHPQRLTMRCSDPLRASRHLLPPPPFRPPCAAVNSPGCHARCCSRSSPPRPGAALSSVRRLFLRFTCATIAPRSAVAELSVVRPSNRSSKGFVTMKEQIACKPALAALAITAWAGVLLQFWLSINLALANGKTVGGGIVVFLGYFTVLTNLFVALTATLPIITGSSRVGRWFGRPMVLGSAVTSILIVGITYHFLLRNVWQAQGLQLLADAVLHYVVPILAFAYWLVFPPRSKLGVFAPLAWCLYPMVYFVYVFARGELLGSYPYYFIDVTRLGYGKAMSNSFGLLISFIVLGAAVLAVAKLRNRFLSPKNPVRG